VVAQPATTGVAIVVVGAVSAGLGGADALVLSAEMVMTPAMANRAVVNFCDDMTYSLSEFYNWYPVVTLLAME
jgi:ABC-type hemin transport system substrate-binding protein